MKLDYLQILHYRFGCGMSAREIADTLHASKSSVNNSLPAFEACEELCYPPPRGLRTPPFTAFYMPDGDGHRCDVRRTGLCQHKRRDAQKEHDAEVSVEPLLCLV